MRAIIVDDESLARERLRTMLADHPDVTVVAECDRGGAAVTAIRAQRPDLVFLDVQMPGMDGFGVLDTIGMTPPPFVIFVTAHAHHAVRAFDQAAGDYLLKPYDDARLARAVDRARNALASRGQHEVTAELRALLGKLGTPASRIERIAVTLGKRTVFIEVSTIDWIEARDNYACLHVGTQQHLVRETLTALEAGLDPSRFVRIHRSTIVRFDQIRELRNLGLGDHAVILRDGRELPVGKRYRERLPQG